MIEVGGHHHLEIKIVNLRKGAKKRKDQKILKKKPGQIKRAARIMRRKWKESVRDRPADTGRVRETGRSEKGDDPGQKAAEEGHPLRGLENAAGRSAETGGQEIREKSGIRKVDLDLVRRLAGIMMKRKKVSTLKRIKITPKNPIIHQRRSHQRNLIIWISQILLNDS